MVARRRRNRMDSCGWASSCATAMMLRRMAETSSSFATFPAARIWKKVVNASMMACSRSSSCWQRAWRALISLPWVETTSTRESSAWPRHRRKYSCRWDAPNLQAAICQLAGAEIRDQRFLGELMISAGKALLMRYRWSDGKQIQADISFDGTNGPSGRQSSRQETASVFQVAGWITCSHGCLEGVVMSGWRPFGNVIVDDVWAWRGGCCWCGRPPYGIAVPE